MIEGYQVSLAYMIIHCFGALSHLYKESVLVE
jgi:hypothetical protein